MEAKEALERTEKRWLAIIADPDDYPLACGWCMFAIERMTGAGSQCPKCPVVRVFGCSCPYIPEYADWDCSYTEGKGELARKVYELLIAHRDQLIAAAKEIENEQAIRD